MQRISDCKLDQLDTLGDGPHRSTGIVVGDVQDQLY